MVQPVTRGIAKQIEKQTFAVVETYGAYLRKMRARRGMTLEELCERTKVKMEYIEALENENFSVLPSEVYVRGFIKAIAQSLNIPPEPALSSYMRALTDLKPTKTVYYSLEQKLTFWQKLWRWFKKLFTGREDEQIFW